MIDLLCLLFGLAIGVAAARQWQDVSHELAKEFYAREKKELADEIKRQREQISRLIGRDA